MSQRTADGLFVLAVGGTDYVKRRDDFKKTNASAALMAAMAGEEVGGPLGVRVSLTRPCHSGNR